MFDKTAEENPMRDGGAAASEPSADNLQPEDRKEYYRSQREVDEAFKKRFAALKKKWEGEQKEKQRAEQDENKVMALLDKIENQSRAFLELYPDVDIYAVVQENPLFAYLVMSGKDIIDAYEFLYAADTKQRIRQALEQEIIGNMKARNTRPRGMNAANSGGSLRDIARFSDADILRIDQRIKNGERVTL